MSLSRRHILRGGAAVGAVLAVRGGTGGGIALAATGAPGTQTRTAPFALSTWKKLAGATVKVADTAGVTLRVAEVRDLIATTHDNRQQGHGEVFVVRFVGASGPGLAEGIHTVEHPAIGRQPMFLRAVGPGAVYEALVNTWLPDAGNGEKKAVDRGATLHR
jgi:hypothetical protein